MNKYVYTLNTRGYDRFHSGHVNSLPILRAYVKWITEDADFEYNAQFVMDGQYAYCHFTGEQTITRFNLRTGDVTPFGNLKGSLETIVDKILLRDGTIYLSGIRKGATCFFALLTADGFVRETRTPDDQKYYCVSLVLPDGKLIVQIYDAKEPEIGCIDESTGRILWRQPGQGGSMVFCGGALICAETKEMYALDLKDGHELWRTRYRDFGISGGVFSDDKRVFVTAMGNCLIAFDGATGREIWRTNTNLYGYALDGKGHVLAAEVKFLGPRSPALLLDTATGKIAAKLPVNLFAVAVVGDWAYATDADITSGQPVNVLGRILSFNVVTGESNILLDARKNAIVNPQSISAAIDGYLVTQSIVEGGKRGWVCLEDMRFHPDATRLLFDARPEMLDERMRGRIAELIQRLGDADWKVRKDATEQLALLMDLPQAQLEEAMKETVPAEIRITAEASRKKVNEWKKLRKYLDDLGCWRDPIYFTALIRHTADPAIQQKAIDRLKQITGQDFDLKPSAEWVKDQKEASDKYDDWWQENRDKLVWSEEVGKYVEK
jgi:outer membrane protein assembly factor BamB